MGMGNGLNLRNILHGWLALFHQTQRRTSLHKGQDSFRGFGVCGEDVMGNKKD